jgi:hypothetical protein
LSIERGQRAQNAGEITRSALAGRVGALDQIDRPAACRQPLGGTAAGQTGTDDDRVLWHAPGVPVDEHSG